MIVTSPPSSSKRSAGWVRAVVAVATKNPTLAEFGRELASLGRKAEFFEVADDCVAPGGLVALVTSSSLRNWALGVPS